MHQKEIQTKSLELSRKYGDKKCQDFADALKKWLVANKVKGEYLTMHNTGRGWFVFAVGRKEPISENANHYGIEVEGTVYDNNFPKGLRRNSWEKSYEASGRLTVKMESF